MIREPSLRLADIKERIGYIRDLLAARSLEELRRDVQAGAALERFFEIISEASRHLPDDWKAAHPNIPWRRIADLGNQLRHAYEGVEPRRLLAIYDNDLDAFEAAIDALIAANPG